MNADILLSKKSCTQVQNIVHSGATPSYISDVVTAYIRNAVSKNTQKAYSYDLEHFTNWGGHIPALPDIIARYLADHAGELSVYTLIRRLAAITKAHRMAGHENPCNHELVRMTIKGIKRTHDITQDQVSPLLRDDLISILNGLSDTPKDIRDKALLMIGFAGALRRSELVALNINDLEFVTEGAILSLRKSKTDQDGLGRKIAIPHGRSRHCPVQAVKAWLQLLPDNTDALFRSIKKGGHVQHKRLSCGAVSNIIKHHVKAIGLEPDTYSGHSLRSGFITTCAQNGTAEWRIMKQSGHKSHQTMMRYIRDANLFDEHPLNGMF